MRSLGMGILALLLLGPTLEARDDAKARTKPDEKKADKPKTPAERYTGILKEFQTEQQAFFKAYQAAKSDEERQKLKFPEARVYAKRLLDLAKDNPQDAAAVDALVWVIQAARHFPEGKEATEKLFRDHLESDKIGPVCQTLRHAPDGEKTLRNILEKNPHKNVKGMASFALAQHLKEQGPKTGKEAEELFERVVKEFADVTMYGRKLGKLAEGELFEVRHLGIGMTAPDIAGEDADSQKFKLSDYRGKVVLLDFWGNW